MWTSRPLAPDVVFVVLYQSRIYCSSSLPVVVVVRCSSVFVSSICLRVVVVLFLLTLWLIKCLHVSYLRPCYRCVCFGVPDETLIAPGLAIFTPFSLPSASFFPLFLCRSLTPNEPVGVMLTFHPHARVLRKESSVYQ